MPLRYPASLATAGVLYALFQASAVTDFSVAEDLWRLGVAVHGLIVVLAMTGLIGIGLGWRLPTEAAVTWWAATALALLGLVVAHPFLAMALLGIAAVLWVRLQARLASTVTAIGGMLWLVIYLLGARVGNEDARALTGAETVTALVALACIGTGLAVAALEIGRNAHGVQDTQRLA